MLDWLDAYTVKARLFPAILAAAPALAFALVQVGGKLSDFGLPEVIITITVAVLFFYLADFSRRSGLRVERRMFAGSGGRPFPTVLRHRDETLDTRSKLRYHTFLATKLGTAAPTALSEASAPKDADGFYIECGNWLRENTRDHERFNVLFNENITYGARRNLLGLKPAGLLLNALVVIISIIQFHSGGWEDVSRHGAILLIAAIHALVFLFLVTEDSVRNASDQYGRQLALSCETLMNS
ncbi:hypothetical protein B5M44_21470 [Shinella sumterensis]|uniref:hypothetical protein n=1 Tax=Shinella sumterensis TaxID=1967501 RepID=UPI00106EC44A|nr:hypothetical protein [Shinella sumterensis]MCD1266854.1 hypothetical protein [Shinella sumterensis]TFE95287.1 hypothetical protein B5M44_21470 [Shinella sumterensis]